MAGKVEKGKIALVIYLISFVFFATLMTGNLLYDEFWTLLYFTPLDIFQILTDLALPNNHPLNTLLMKFCAEFSGTVLILRLPALLAGAAIPLLCGELASRFSKDNQLPAMISGALLALLSAPLAIYSGIARGYAMQMFFLLLCVWAMSKSKENPRFAAIWMTIGALGTILTVPSGALFLPSAAAGLLIYASPDMRKNRDMWIAAGVIAAAGGFFYGINFNALRSGQSWGNEINSLDSFKDFLTSTLSALVIVPALIPAAYALVKPVKRLWAAGLLFLPLLISIFTNGGPERCYLYLAAAIAVAGGMGIAELAGLSSRYSAVIAAVVSLLLGGGGFFLQYEKWRQTDYIRVFDDCRRELPADVLPILRSTAGFPVRCGSTDTEISEFNRKMFGGGFSRIAVLECKNGVFNGMDVKMSEKTLRSGVSGQKGEVGGVPCCFYRVTPVKKVREGDCFLLLFSGKDNLAELLDKHGNMLYLNSWLTTAGKMAVFDCRSIPDELPDGVKIYRIGGAE